MTSDGRQAGRPYTWERSGPAGENLCFAEHADGFLSFSDPVRHDSGAKARIRFKKPHKPDDVNIAAWRELNDNGYPRGRAERVRFHLKKRVISGDVVAWDAIFRLRERGHYYLDVFAEWSGAHPCRGVSASWTFHLKSV